MTPYPPWYVRMTRRAARALPPGLAPRLLRRPELRAVPPAALLRCAAALLRGDGCAADWRRYGAAVGVAGDVVEGTAQAA